MAGVISEIITEYYKLVEERNDLRMKSKKLQGALHLADLMIINGEKHSDTSKKMIKELIDSSFLGI